MGGRRKTAAACAAAALLLGAAAAAPPARAQGTPPNPATGGTLPSTTFTPDQLYTRIAPDMGAIKHNQPSVVNGWLMLSGNGRHSLWDIAAPFAPEHLSDFESTHDAGESESHTVAFSRSADGRHRAATITGKGVDLWDLTDAAAPTLLAEVVLEGIDYGDNTNAVWGVFWQGAFLYVGGTNTGVHIVDTTDPTAPTVVTRIPTAELGGVSAGPLFAIGNLLVVTTPKNHAGIATLDIGDPAAPTLLDFELPEAESYIGMMYGRHAYLLTPFRTYDVTTDPADIQLLGSVQTKKVEYLSFGDGHAFVGRLRPDGGVYKYLLGDDPTVLTEVAFIEGRKKNELQAFFTDDQFPLPIGNILVMSDDEVNIGSTLAVHDLAPDSIPPAVAYVNPPDGATAQPLTTRVGLSFTDQIDLRSVDAGTVILRPASGGAPLPGTFGQMQTFVTFWPATPLAPETAYELVLPAGGVRDLAGNALAETFVAVFSTGAALTALPCHVGALPPVEVGAAAQLTAAVAPPGATLTWDYGDGQSGPGAHTWSAPGRWPVVLTVAQGGQTRTCAGVQVVHRPLTARAPSASGPIAVDAARGRAWVVNPDASTLAAVHIDNATKDFEVQVAKDPRTVAQSPNDGLLWVAGYGGDALTLVEPAGGDVVDTLALRHGAAPFGVAFTPDGGRAVVSLEGTGQLAVLDAATRAPVATVDLGAPVRGVAVSADSARALVARLISPAGRGEVFDVDLAGGGALAGVLALAKSPGPDASDRGRGVPNLLGAPAISPDGTEAFVGGKLDNTDRGLARDGEPLSTTNTVRTVVSRLDLGAGAEDLARRVDLDDHNLACAALASPVGDLLFVASLGTNRVDVLDAYDGRRVAGFATGLAPHGLALAPGGRLLVANLNARTLGIYDVAGLLAGTDAAATRLAEVVTVASEPLAPALLLGKQLFYNADSPQMSQDGYISCATCHLDGAEDGRVWDFTDRGEGLRNTIDLRGRAGTGHGPVHWTANFDEIQDFENDIRGHFGGSGLMADADFLAEDRADPLGAPKAGLSERLDALAAYVASFAAAPRSPFRNADGSRTAAAEAGALLFRQLDCLDCHAGQALTDSGEARHDVGTLTPQSGQRRGGPLDGLDTPTLRGVWATAPYFHDGSAATLEATLAVAGHGNAHLLSASEREELLAFLRELEDEPVELTRLPRPEPAPEGGPEEAAEPAPEAGGTGGGGGGGCAGGGAGGGWGLGAALLGLVAAGAARRRRRKGNL